jgi:hypothetical protein
MTKRLKRVPSVLSGLRQAEPLKDLGEHGNRKRSSGDIRRSHKQPHHRGDLVGPRRSNQKAGLMKDRVDRLAQGTKSRTRPDRLGRRRCDSDVSAAAAQAASEAAE